MELLGKNISDFRKDEPDNRLSVRTAAYLAHQVTHTFSFLFSSLFLAILFYQSITGKELYLEKNKNIYQRKKKMLKEKAIYI